MGELEVITPEIITPEDYQKQLLIEEYWKRGRLAYKLRPIQKLLYEKTWEAINDPNCRKFSALCHRRMGKSFCYLVIALEYAIRFPKSQIRYFAPYKVDLKDYLIPIFLDIIEDWPFGEDTKPYYLKSEETIYVPATHSKIPFAATNGGSATRARGRENNLVILDEAADMDELEEFWKGNLIHTTLNSGGKALIPTTPPTSPDHDWVVLHRECMEEGHYLIYTIDDNPFFDAAKKRSYIEEVGGAQSTRCRRELYCEIITEETLVIVPEWQPGYVYDPPAENRAKEDNYPHWHKYISMDYGTVDWTAILYGYFDWSQQILFIEAETLMRGDKVNSHTIAEAIRQQQVNLGWREEEVYRRVSDHTDLLNDLSAFHKLSFTQTDKEDKDVMVNVLREAVMKGKVRVSSDCPMLIGCLEHGVWATKKKNGNRIKDPGNFARSKMYGHYDPLDALIYMIRKVDKYTNPLPLNQGISPATHHINWLEDPNRARQPDLAEWNKLGRVRNRYHRR